MGELVYCDDHKDYGCDDVVLRRSVKKLHFGRWEEKEEAAAEIKRLLAEEEEPRRRRRRKFMAELGVIPPLVDMVGSELVERRRLAVQALIQLAHGSYTNKALMVEAGILSKLPRKQLTDESTLQEFLQLLLSVSSLSTTPQFPAIINSSRITPFLVSILQTTKHNKTIDLCLDTLHILSSVLGNSGILVGNGILISILLRLCSIKEASEKALEILGNLVVTKMGKRAIEEDAFVPDCLIEVMAREEKKPRCQELAVYVLMVLAHQSSVQRQKMAKADIVPVLLEVALLSSPLAQKRAMKLLQWFKDKRQRNVDSHSGPQILRREAWMGSPVCSGEGDEGKRLLKKMVKQSLYRNLETITRRANSSGEPSSRLRNLAVNSSSKSLPY